MSDIKYTKNEFLRLQKKHVQLVRYLPTLQLKKMLLQVEVNKAENEIHNKTKHFESEKDRRWDDIKLLNYPFLSNYLQSLKVKDVIIDYQNIAGVEIPLVKDVIFEKADYSLLHQPIWMVSLSHVMESFQKIYKEIIIAQKKREILQNELRIVSIRVNLFEKRLIPELEKDMNKIRIFLDDTDMQAVCQAKVAKEKTLARKMERMA